MTGVVHPGGPPNATGRPRLRRLLVWGVVLTVFLLCALLLSRLVTLSVGVSGALLGLVVSTTVIGIVLPVLLWVDRLEAEPARWLWFAFGWGALVATSASIVGNLLVTELALDLGADPAVAGPVLAAPVVEELCKGLGVLVIFWAARREFNGVVDGIVYAGVVALGFAYVEDIIYLGSNYQALGQEGLISTFVVRCLVSPFAHPMFTVPIGIAVGLLAHRRRWSAAWIPLLGYAVAVAGHALWNASAMVSEFLTLYVVVQVPLFVGFVLLLVLARRQEAATMREHLTGYGINGWFSPQEVSMLTSPAERRRARRWAASPGDPAKVTAMRAFQDEAAELAIAREHLQRGDHHQDWVRREQLLLASVTAHRQGFSGPSPGGVGVRQQ